MKKSDLPEFQWTPACQEGFDQLKKALTEAPCIGISGLLKTVYIGNGCIAQRFRRGPVSKRGR